MWVFMPHNNGMKNPVTFLNGRWIPEAEAVVSVGDIGFTLGATVTEQLRTFAGKIFHLDDHLQRLEHSLDIVGIDPGMSRDELGQVALELVDRNHRLPCDGDDLGLAMFVTPGVNPTFAPHAPAGPTVCMHTYLLPFGTWTGAYQHGQSLITSAFEQVSPRTWPPSLKCRSRMHYYLADCEADQAEAGARAMLTDENGMVTEASTANLIIYKSGKGLISPPMDKILHGISLAVAFELAGQLDIPTLEQDLTPADVAAADEVLLSSTPLCLLPVTRLDGRPIADGKPGKVFGRLMAAWSDKVQVDIMAQAERFAQRP